MAAPNFTQSLEPVSVTEGQPAVFRAAFSGQPNPVVKWYRYSFPVHDSKDFKIFTTDTESVLTIAKTCADDSGVFTCLLENIVGAAKSSSNLNVLEAGQEYVMQVGGLLTEYLTLYWYNLSLEYTGVGENSGKLREAA
jgi:titin